MSEGGEVGYGAGGVGCAEDKGAGNEDFGSGLDETASGLDIDATVNLDEGL